MVVYSQVRYVAVHIISHTSLSNFKIFLSKSQMVDVDYDEHHVLCKKLLKTHRKALKEDTTKESPRVIPCRDAFEVLVTSISDNGNFEPENLVAVTVVFFHAQYNACLLNANGHTALEATIHASALLLNHVCALLEPSQFIIESILKQLDEYIFPRLQLLSRDTQSFMVHEVAKLLMWLSQYQDRLEHRYPGVTLPRNRAEYMEELSAEYTMRGVHEPLHQMIRRSLEMNESEGVDRGEDGHFCSQLPQDIALFLTSQLNTAKLFLPRRFFPDVIKGCHEELFNMIGALMLQVETRWQSLPVEYLCSIVVDFQRLTDITAEIFGPVNSTETQHELTEVLVSELIQLSVLANRYLCELRFLDFKETFFNLIGGPEWETGMVAVDNTMLELRDFLIDVQTWIQGDFFYGKALKSCFDLLLQSYVAAFLSNTVARGLQHSPKVAEIIQRDFNEFTNFFCIELAEQHARHGFYTLDAMKVRLQVLCAFANILACTSPKAVETDIETVCHQFGRDNGMPVVLHVVALRSPTRLTLKESSEWHVQLWRAGEKLKMQMVDNDSFYKVPDMRNSCVIRRIKSLKREHIPDSKTQPTTLLVQRVLLSKIVARSKRMIGSDRTLLSTWNHEEGEKVSSQY